MDLERVTIRRSSKIRSCRPSIRLEQAVGVEWLMGLVLGKRNVKNLM